MLRLLEHEIDEVRRLLGEVPTMPTEKDGTGLTTCGECKANVAFEYSYEGETLDEKAISRQFAINVVERVGAIYDKARSRALRGSLAGLVA